MISSRITELFQMLQCSNTDIAQFAGCTPSNVSRIKRGQRNPGPGSRAVLRLAEGIYRYADYENMLDILTKLCDTEDTSAESLIPAIAAWLYDEKEYVPPRIITPKSKREKESLRRSFGERLDKLMTLLKLSNVRFAGQLNVDASLISRYRSGSSYPTRHNSLREQMSALLVSRAEKTGMLEKVSELCFGSNEEFDAEDLAAWLFEPEPQPDTAAAGMLLHSIDAFTPGGGLPSGGMTPPHVPVQERYFGTEGLRNAVIRFLSDAAAEGGELLLYSDEPMDWMSGDREYFALWAALMAESIRGGVHIKIIHNIDRNSPEMISAITGWLPLYASGQIEPHVLRKTRSGRFYHTAFLHLGKACISGYYPACAADRPWYDYITDKERLGIIASDYNEMLSGSAAFLKTYPISAADELREYISGNQSEKRLSIINGFSIETLPEKLVEKMLRRAQIPEFEKNRILDVCSERRKQFEDSLRNGSVNEIVCLPEKDHREGAEELRLPGLMISGVPLCYTPEELCWHADAVMELVRNEQNYHLTFMDAAPFSGIQVYILKDSVAVLRCREPYTAFVFTDEMLTGAFGEYAGSLIKQYSRDRRETLKALDEYKSI